MTGGPFGLFRWWLSPKDGGVLSSFDGGAAPIERTDAKSAQGRMRDMHDGLGTGMVAGPASSVELPQQGNSDREAVAQFAGHVVAEATPRI